MKYTKHFLNGIDSVLAPSLNSFRFPSPITPYIQPHFFAVLKFLKSSYGTELARQKKAAKNPLSEESANT